MLATVRSPSVLGINCGILYEWGTRVWPHLPLRIRQLAEDVHALFLSAPGPD